VAQILDPAEGAIYVLDPGMSIAHRIAVSVKLSVVHPEQTALADRPPWSTTRPDGSVFTVETLGTQVIGGFSTYGTRTTTHYPVGSVRATTSQSNP
jgi:hypothetical protein